MNLSFIQDENGVELIDGITYEFPYTMHERDLSDFIVPWHWHEELEFDYAHRGSLVIETMAKTYPIRQGEAYFINTNVMKTKRKAEGEPVAIEHAHLFHPTLLAGSYRSIFETKYLSPILKNQSIEVVVIGEGTASGREFLRILHTLTRLHAETDQEFQIRNLLSEAWLVLMREIRAQKQGALTQSPHTHEPVKNILNFLHKHYAEKITLRDVARHVGVSEKECIRCFKTTFHQTPIEYLVGYRIEQAKHLLAQTSEPVTDIAFQTGFNNSAYFGKTFKRHTQLTPRQYRGASKTP
ncbi:AraC family transcriptional regulator [Feifania hominis]|uniref:Helix-turn-helix transcriptional regulator n=1 Tax=Feifania hominis TaxID=2763660 RepID=A0A926HQR5_9FIRM|nr:AraC family transcriptional regulator [Feifania hominis]MBC8536627.1 helix-turn-helix transcriptional regulator [Feifania hominis]